MKERCGPPCNTDGVLDGATVWPVHHDHSQVAAAGFGAMRTKRARARAVVVVAANLGIPGDT